MNREKNGLARLRSNAPVGAIPGPRSSRRGRRSYSYLIAAVTATGLLAAGAVQAAKPEVSPAKTFEQAGMVDIRSLVPDIAEDIKYAGSDNFTGAPVDGYLAAKCYLLKPAAEALARVERDLRKRHMRLKIWDCYRPARAVADFVRWAHDLDDKSTKTKHYPDIHKSDLLGEYIAPVSNHSRGATVDLTLLHCDAHAKHCQPFDMGTHFDFFDPLAHTDSPMATPAQLENRHRLRTAMELEGFRNYKKEWWHYTLQMKPAPEAIYDVPVK